jgi:nucleoside-diphosphate-sugar epimerase
MSNRLAVIGASGFVGSALTEYALDHTDLAVTPFCHSTGGAARLAHRGLDIRQLDLLDRHAVQTALQGFDYVANCSRGGSRLMLDGLENLLDASRKAGVKKLVHLSSVSIYGDPPHPASMHEDAPTEPAPGSYGALKLAQDEKVQRAASHGLNAVILCPPNIVGPYSDYLTDIIDSIESGRFRLLDGGARSINIVDVNNLSACILSALSSVVNDGRRLFACEPAAITWRELCAELLPVVRGSAEIGEMDAGEFAATASTDIGQAPGKRHSGGALKHLMSDEVRSALRLNSTWAAVETKAKAGMRMLGADVEGQLRTTFNGPIKVTVKRQEDALSRALIAQQLRDVRHDPSRCHRELGFAPPVSFAESMQSFRNWYKSHFESDTSEWTLLGEAAR